jgi:uncharacterized RDD family membrane protein YckC
MEPPAPPGPQSPQPEVPPGAAPPPSPGGSPGYTGPVPPGGWTPAQQQAQPPGLAGVALASWGSRLGAYIIDGLVILIPAVILFIVLVAGAVGLSGSDDDVATGAAIGAVLLWILLVGVVYLLYAPLLMARKGARNGQTWGKQLLDIRVVRDNGQPMTFGSAALREVVFKFLAVSIASSIIPLIPWFLNFFWPLWDDQNRALHDMASSTHVVKA